MVHQASRAWTGALLRGFMTFGHTIKTGAGALAAGLLLAACGSGPFEKAEYAVCDEATQPMGFAAADFNGDGVDDLAVACSRGGNGEEGGHVAVYLAGPESGLTLDETYRVDKGPDFLTAADLNADGHPDLVVTLRGAHERGVARLIGEGDGSFGGATVHSLGGFGVEPVAVADTNDDGAMDILIPARNRVLVNRGSADRPGPFDEERLTDRGRRRDGTVADTDNDGVMDGIRLLPRHGQLHVYRGGTGERVDVIVGKDIRAVFSVYGGADFNGDGRLDPLLEMVAEGQGREVRIALSGDGEEWEIGPALTALGHPRAIAAADFDRDGKPDLLTSERADPDREEHRLTLYPGAGNGTFAEGEPLGIPGFANELLVADFNGDGAPDVAVRHHAESRVTILLNNPGAGS